MTGVRGSSKNCTMTTQLNMFWYNSTSNYETNHHVRWIIEKSMGHGFHRFPLPGWAMWGWLLWLEHGRLRPSFWARSPRNAQFFWRRAVQVKPNSSKRQFFFQYMIGSMSETSLLWNILNMNRNMVQFLDYGFSIGPDKIYQSLDVPSDKIGKWICFFFRKHVQVVFCPAHA